MKSSAPFRGALAALPVLAALLGVPGPAPAVVGGRQAGAGPLASGAVMVLSSRGGVCSGVVVAPDAVLTAGHCASGAPEHRVHYKGPDGAPVLLAPAAIAVHPGYDAGAIAARRRSIDLALVRLEGPLPAAFRPARLGAEAPAGGAALRLGGYGVAREGEARSTGTFRETDLALVEPYGPSRILVWLRGAGTPSAAGACNGDSGGPIAVASGAVVAVATWATGAKGRACGDLTQGVLVGPQRGWLDATLGGWGTSAHWE